MKADKLYWKELWAKALKNTPYRLANSWQRVIDEDLNAVVGHYRVQYQTGQLSCLCRLLDIKLYSQNGTNTHVGHLKIRASISRGSRPKDPEVRRKIELMASPFGPYLAMQKLKQLGIADRYHMLKT